MAGKAPAFQLYAADFYMDTVGWSCEEVGLYFRLLMAEWVNGPLPDDPPRLAKTCQISLKKFQVNFILLAPKFVKTEGGFLINERLEKTREAQQHFIEIQREKGKKRADERWAGHIATATKRLQPEGKPENASSSSSSNSKDNTPHTPRKRGDEYEKDFLTFWTAYPKKAKKPNAYREWRKLGTKRPDIAFLIACIAKQKTWRTWIEGYIPDPERWLKNERWSDEKPPDGGNGKGIRTVNDYGKIPEYKPEDTPRVTTAEREARIQQIQEFTKKIG